MGGDFFELGTVMGEEWWISAREELQEYRSGLNMGWSGGEASKLRAREGLGFEGGVCGLSMIRFTNEGEAKKLTLTTWESASSAGLPLRTSKLDLIFRNDRLSTRLEGLSVADDDMETGLKFSSNLGEPVSGVQVKAIVVFAYFFGVSGLGSVSG